MSTEPEHTPSQPAPPPPAPGREPKYTRIHRLLRIVTLAQGHTGWTPAKLADECDVDERTIYRDIREIEGAGVPIFFDADSGGYRLRGEFFLPPVSLTAEEALALALLCERIARPEQIAHLGAAYRALAKIEAAMPAPVRDQIAQMSDRVDILTAQASPAGSDTDVYVKVQRAIATRRALVCRYESADAGRAAAAGTAASTTSSSKDFRFDPYALLFSVRAWYAVGRHGGRGGGAGEIRQLKLSRFTLVKPTDEPYEIPEGWSLQTHLGNAWRTIAGTPECAVRVRFDPVVAPTMADTIWHRTQQLDEHEDGSVTFSCTVAGLDEIVWWILGYGSHATVLEPPELVARVREELVSAVRAYAEPPAPTTATKTGKGRAAPADRKGPTE